MPRKKTGPPPKPPKSLPATLKGVIIGHAAKTLMGTHQQLFPLSQGPRTLPIFNQGYKMMFNRPEIRNHRGIHRISFPNATNSKMVKFLNFQFNNIERVKNYPTKNYPKNYPKKLSQKYNLK